MRHAAVKEFYTPSRKYIYLLDDNILAYEHWEDVFNELAEIGAPFRFHQGLDIRLLTEQKATKISSSKNHGDFIFAFDHIKDKDTIERNLKLWNKYRNGKSTKLYVLVAHESQGVQDVVGAFERIRILMQHGCLPYIMRYESYKTSPMYGMYTNLAAWCNQPNFFKKMTFREFCIVRGSPTTGRKGAAWRYMEEFESAYPQVAKEYFDMRYDNVKNSKPSR